ncbi:hypothetical protein [Halegenticoccus tardaugens]|nr:hypothetical protein [Halegenticoccus tardaugens]
MVGRDDAEPPEAPLSEPLGDTRKRITEQSALLVRIGVSDRDQE